MIAVVAVTVVAFCAVAAGLWLTNYVYKRSRAKQWSEYGAEYTARHKQKKRDHLRLVYVRNERQDN